MAPTEEVLRWFADALKPTDPRPSRAACDKLARELQIIFIRQQNEEREKKGPVDVLELKDVSPAAELDKRVARLMRAANAVLAAGEELEDYNGGYVWECIGGGSVSLDDVKKMLGRIGAFPRPLPPPPEPPRGQPKNPWVAPAREFARLIQKAMKAEGYSGTLAMTNEDSVTAIVGAAAIRWAYREKKLQPGAFATAMRRRDRSKKAANLKPADFFTRFPEAGRFKSP